MKAVSRNCSATAATAAATLMLACSLASASTNNPAPASSDPAGVLADHGIMGSGIPLQGSVRKQLEQLPMLPHVTTRRALAVITDFQDSHFEDWQGPGFNSVGEVNQTLQEMETHWRYLSHRTEAMQWDIIRITLPVNLTPDAYASWPDFRNAAAALIRQQVDVSRYDANHDGVIDSAWLVMASKDFDYGYLIGGTSSNGGVNMFVDGQGDLSAATDSYGNFNHELGHTLGLPDIYGPYGTLGYLTLMADSWPVPPQDFSAYERRLLGWATPRTLAPGRHTVTLRPATQSFDALRIPSGRPGEYFLIEYRHRPDSGFGSSAPDYNGLAVYHVLEDSSQWMDPPLLKLEAADGSIAPDTSPAPEDFFYPGNPAMRTPYVARSYFANTPVFALDKLRWSARGLTFDIGVLPPVSPTIGNLLLPNRIANPSFESGSGGQPASWTPDAFEATSVFDWLSGSAQDGQRSVVITSLQPNDARWIQTVSGLTPGRGYQFCGHVRGSHISTTPEAQVGANVSVMGDFVRSRSLAGSFDWQQLCVIDQPQTSSNTYACRLGFYGSTVTGRLWCDNMSLLPLRSAFQ